MLPSMPEAPQTRKITTGTFLKVITAVWGVGQEQRELRSLRKAEGSLLVASLPEGVTSVSFHVLIYYFNCALTRDLIMPREQIYKFEHVFLLSALLLITLEVFYSFLAVATCGWRHYLCLLQLWQKQTCCGYSLALQEVPFGFGCSL